MKRMDLTGQKFGRLTALSLVGTKSTGAKATIWKCRCDCGKETIVSAGSLRNGATKSCGCFRAELNKRRSKGIKHGFARTRVYRIYAGIKQRCYNPKCRIYWKYGGNGIKMADEWLSNPVVFITWALAHGYNDTLSIDRIDPSKGYTPDNCRWATIIEQNTHLRQRVSEESGMRGVCWSKKERRWICVVSTNNKTIRIGSFKDKIEAAKARNEYITKTNLLNELSNIPENTACEIDRDYYAAAMERIREYQKQQTFNFMEVDT
jgi:hypothetical protein